MGDKKYKPPALKTMVVMVVVGALASSSFWEAGKFSLTLSLSSLTAYIYASQSNTVFAQELDGGSDNNNNNDTRSITAADTDATLGDEEQQLLLRNETTSRDASLDGEVGSDGNETTDEGIAQNTRDSTNVTRQDQLSQSSPASVTGPDVMTPNISYCEGKMADIQGSGEILGAEAGYEVIIVGSADVDYIYGLGANETICGRGGNDYIDGGQGMERIFGENGNDYAIGGSHEDLIDGGEGNDHLLGGNERDQLYGGHGNDQLNGGEGIDSGEGGPGFDSCYGIESMVSCEIPWLRMSAG